MNNTIWAYGVPQEVREKMVGCLVDFDFKFPTTRKSILDDLHRIRVDEGDIVALWCGEAPLGFGEYVEGKAPSVVSIEPIELSVEGEDGAQISEVVGVKFDRVLGPELDMCAPAQLETSELDGIVSILSFEVFKYFGSSDQDLQLPETAADKVFVAPNSAWFHDNIDSNQEQLDKFVNALGEKYHGSELYLIVDTRADFFEYLTSDELTGVIKKRLNPKWLAAADLVVTNDAGIREIASQYNKKIDAAGPVANWNDGLSLESHALYVKDVADLVRERFLTGARYFVEASLPPRDDHGLGLVLEARGAGIAAGCSSENLCEFSLGAGAIVDLDKVAFEKIASEYDITHFDDRATGDELACILPFRFSEDRPDALQRLKYAEMDPSRPEGVDLIVVDDGSSEEAAAELRSICADLGYSYIYNASAEKDFSVGRCRNIGAEYARSRFILMQDIDLMPYDGFYRNILNEIEIQGMKEDAKQFLMVPYVFLTERGTQCFQNLAPGLRRQALIHAAITNDESLVEKFSTGTSANIYNRHWYLSRGGNSRDFEGWGYEDIEFNTRMIRHLKLFPLPKNWTEEKFNFNSVTEYRTYKSLYRIFGDMLMMKGIALFHAWHPVHSDGSYNAKAAENREIFINKLRRFPAHQEEPDPLPDRSKGRTLIFRKNPFTMARMALPAFGEIYFVPREQDLPNKESLAAFLQQHAIERIVFFNPYQTRHMRRIQVWARELGIPFLVAERGALPNTSFYDSNGFLLDSTTYAPEHWDKPLSTVQLSKVDDFITRLRYDRPVLEAQTPAEGSAKLRQRLGIKNDEKVIFIPLQRPGDTVTRFFARDVSYAEFEEQVWDLASKEIPGCRVLIKTHPLEDSDRDWGHAVNVDQENIYDLIAACDLVWCFNSGVGVLSAIWEKFCALSGGAFYAIDGVNQYVNGVEDILALIQDVPAVDVKTSKRFVHHLVENVYSFGTQETKPVRMPDGSRMTATTNIHYTTLRLEGAEHNFSDRTKAKHSTKSPLFDRYRNAGFQK